MKSVEKIKQAREGHIAATALYHKMIADAIQVGDYVLVTKGGSERWCEVLLVVDERVVVRNPKSGRKFTVYVNWVANVSRNGCGI